MPINKERIFSEKSKITIRPLAEGEASFLKLQVVEMYTSGQAAKPFKFQAINTKLQSSVSIVVWESEKDETILVGQRRPGMALKEGCAEKAFS